MLNISQPSFFVKIFISLLFLGGKRKRYCNRGETKKPKQTQDSYRATKAKWKSLRKKFSLSLTFACMNHEETLLALVLLAKGVLKCLIVYVKYSYLDVPFSYLTLKVYLVFSTMESSVPPLA